MPERNANMRYLEYEERTGRILSEITADTIPATAEGVKLLQIGDTDQIDTLTHIITGGAVKKNVETNAERLERERLKREHQQAARLRLKAMTFELCLAILDNSSETVKELQEEYAGMKALL